MSKSQNTKNERNADVSKTLTEQWKKGELPVGEYYYYTTIFSPTVHIQNFTRDVVSFQDFKETVAEVLAPVPSYEEWKALKASYEMSNDANLKQATWMADMEKHNAKLEELLKKANKFLKDYGFTFDGKDCAEAFKVHTKINEVLQ